MTTPTFLWYDYETFGVNPRADRPAQFAAIRTDLNFNVIGEPMMWYCQTALDTVPQVGACLVTGILPQECDDKGLPEAEFAARIQAEFARAGTIGVGYNSLKFDSEVTRFLLWRNLLEPYDHEWKNDCARWDILPLVRAVYALKPHALNWIYKEDGTVSLKLTDLSAANGLSHEKAHDALSDVEATIALAKLIQEKEPKLFEFYLNLRKKSAVYEQLTLLKPAPVLHASGMFGASKGYLRAVYPLAQHPTNTNEIIVWDLNENPDILRELSAEEVRLRLFTRQDDLPEGVTRLPIKTIHINQAPFVVKNFKVLSPERAAQLGMDLDRVAQHTQAAYELPNLAPLWAKVFDRTNYFAEKTEAEPAETALYAGFLPDADKQKAHGLRLRTLSSLPPFSDARMADLALFYAAKSQPDLLNEAQKNKWQAHCTSLWAKALPQILQDIATACLGAKPADLLMLANLQAWCKKRALEAGVSSEDEA
jgi:exodeoxyribonuclease-1